MTLKNNSIKNKLVSIFLVLILAIPIIIKSVHSHEAECQQNSNDGITHLYELSNDICDICYFSFSQFYVSSVTFIPLVFDIPYQKVIKDFTPLLWFTYNYSNKQLRAPPGI